MLEVFGKYKSYFVLLVLIFVLFSAIKYPYWNKSHTIPHPMKYQRTVEPVINMRKNDNPFHYEEFFKVRPSASGSLGVRSEFPNIPIREWGLLSFTYLSPWGCIESNTELFMNAIGILTLLFAFLYFSKVFNHFYSIIFTAFLSISYLFNLISFASPKDSFMFLFFFPALIFLEKFFDSSNPKFLFIAGILGGIGINQKYSLFLILAPIALVLLFCRSRDTENFLSRLALFFPALVIPEIVFILSISKLPSRTLHGTLSFLLLTAIVYTIYRKSDMISEKITQTVGYIFERPLLIIPLGLTLIVAGHTFLKLAGLYYYTENFITDRALVFNLEMYKYMLFEPGHIRDLVTEPVFYLGLVGLGGLPFLNISREQKITAIGFVAGMISYWIVASKPIFFHQYYKLIFTIVFAMLAALIIYEIAKRTKSIMRDIVQNPLSDISVVIVAGALIFLIAFPANYSLIDQNLSREIDGFQEPAEYLKQNTNRNDMFILGGGRSFLLSLYAQRYSTTAGHLATDMVREKVQRIGFKETMENLRIKYLISQGNPNFWGLADAFTDNFPEPFSRTRIIKKRIGQTDKPRYVAQDEREMFVERLGIKDYFVLENEINGFRFYKIVSPRD